MSIVQLVVVLIVAGLGMWLINRYIPMQSGIKKILNVVVIISVVFYILAAFGIIGNIPMVRIGR